MPSRDEAVERADVDDAEMSESNESDDTESDASGTELLPGAAAPQNSRANEIPSAAAADVEDVPVDTIQNGGEMLKVEDVSAISVIPALSAGYESAPRLFQKVWRDEDELMVLQGFYEFTSSRGTTHADYQYDTGLFYDQIKDRLQLHFTKNQLIDKLRRLKKKYRTAVARIDQGRAAVFKTPHDRATFEISRNIWSPVFKRSLCEINDGENAVDASAANRRSVRRRRVKSEQSTPIHVTAATAIDPNHVAPHEVPPAAVAPSLDQISAPSLPQPTPTPQMSAAATPAAAAVGSAPNSSSVVEETVHRCLSPLLKEMMKIAIGSGRVATVIGGGLLTPLGWGGVVRDEEEWRKHQIVELEVYAKRLELVQEEIKVRLQELRR